MGKAPPAPAAAGFVVADLARRYRVSPDKIRRWIKAGAIVACNTSDTRCGRPRYVVTPEALAAFERGRQAAPPPAPAKRRKRTVKVDYYPD